jgi:hypothetical protein
MLVGFTFTFSITSVDIAVVPALGLSQLLSLSDDSIEANDG